MPSLRAVLALLLGGIGACSTDEDRGLPPATALERRAEALLAEGEAQAASALFESELQSRPGAWLSWVGLLRVALATSDRKLADLALQGSLDNLPKTPECRELLARTLLELARREEGGIRRQHALIAGRLLVEVQRADPKFPRLTYHAGVAELLMGRPASARHLATAELNNDPDFEPAWDLLVRALEAEGRPKDVVETLRPRAEAGTLTLSLREALLRAEERLAIEGQGPKPSSANNSGGSALRSPGRLREDG